MGNIRQLFGTWRIEAGAQTFGTSIMRCPNCGIENLTNAKFCDECATPLPQTCPSCGMENRARAKFCSECAAPLREQYRIQSLAFTSDFGPRPLNSQPKTQTPTPIQYTPNHLA